MTAHVKPASLDQASQVQLSQKGITSTFRKGNTSIFLFKFLLFNLLGAALLVAGWMQGWMETIVFSDPTGITMLISGTFLMGLVYCAYKIWRLHGELSCLGKNVSCAGTWATQYFEKISDRQSGSRAITDSAFRLQITSWIAPVRHIANSLVLLGLIGTVVGFIIALSGVDPEAASDVSSISPMVSTLLSGMSVALYTTLVGAILNLWLMINYHMLTAAAGELVVNLIALGESHARS